MSGLCGALPKQDQITGRVLGGSSRLTPELTTTRYRNEQSLLDWWPGLIKQHSTRQRALSLLFALLLNTGCAFKQGQSENCLFTKGTGHSPSLTGKAGNPALRAGSKGKKVQANSSHGGLLAAGAFLHFISCRGGDGAREMPSRPPHSHSITQKACVGPRKAGTEQEKSKPQDYLFALTSNWAGDTS